MKRLSLVLFLFVLTSAGSEVLHYSSALSEAFSAYKEQATIQAIEQRHGPSLEPLEGYILDVTYILQSIDFEGRNTVRLVAIQSVHFQKGLPTLNWWARKIAKTQHRVLMTKAHGRWQVSELEADATEVTTLADSLSPP